MVSLAFNGFGLERTAIAHLRDNPDSWFWSFIKFQTSHVQWLGCSYWDLIQPAFMFMVGLSMAYSYVKRQREGHSYRRMLGHATTRAFILIGLGIFLSSQGAATRWWFTNVLAQMGLGYVFLFLLWGRGVRNQAIAAGATLVITWILYVAYPGSGLDLSQGAPDRNVSPKWAQTHLENVGPSWHKNANVGHAFDVWLLNLMPKRAPFTGEGSEQIRKPFVANPGGYQTLNFLPSLATMIFGLMCGELLRSQKRREEKVRLILVASIAGIALGWLLGAAGVCPLVKRIWTPSWALFSTGWCGLMLAGLYWLIDIKQRSGWVFPFVVVGVNSTAIYIMGMTLRPWVAKKLKIHLGDELFLIGGPKFEPMFQATFVGLCLWLVCYGMYRQKWFLRI